MSEKTPSPMELRWRHLQMVHDVRARGVLSKETQAMKKPFIFKKKCIQRTNELPRTTPPRRPDIDLSLEIICYEIVRERQEHWEPISRDAIAEICGVHVSLIAQIEQRAIKKVREKLRKEFRMTFGQMAASDHSGL